MYIVYICICIFLFTPFRMCVYVYIQQHVWLLAQACALSVISEPLPTFPSPLPVRVLEVQTQGPSDPVMDRVSNGAVILILGYGGVSLYGRVNTLNIAFKIATSNYIVRAVLEFPLDPRAVCTLMNYDVSQSRVERLVDIARRKGDLLLMNESEFRKLIVLQLGLTHLRNSRPHPHIIRGQDIFELLLRSVSPRLTPAHSTSVRVLQSLTLQSELLEHPLALDVGDTISRMQTLWRLSTMDFLCIQTVFMLLYWLAESWPAEVARILDM